MPDTTTVLIVDDNRTNLALTDMLLRKLTHFSTILQTSPQALMADVARLDYDLAIIACRLPQIDGIALAQRLRAQPQLRDKPILLAADEPDPALRSRALDAGITDVLVKPFNPVDLRSRLVELARHARPEAAATATAAPAWNGGATPATILSADDEDYLALLTRVASVRERESPLHSRRVGRYCAILAHHLGLSEEACRTIRLAAPLHDIGKAGLADGLLHKKGVLTPEDRAAMENHTRIGWSLLQGCRSPVFRMAAEIALSHHERWDGTGYPQRLRGEQIPLVGRIAAVADVFDALTSLRSYKTAWTFANATTYLKENAGEQFDPSCIAAFVTGKDEINETMRVMQDAADDDTDEAADAA